MIEEFLEETLSLGVSPSLPVELSNITTAFQMIMDSIHDSRMVDVQRLVQDQLQQARSTQQLLEDLITRLNEQSIQIEAEELAKTVMCEGLQGEWVSCFLRQKQKQTIRTIAASIKEGVKSSGIDLQEKPFTKYITSLQHIGRILAEDGKPSKEVLEQADQLRRQIKDQNQVQRFMQIVEEKTSQLINKLRQVMSRINNLFDLQLSQETIPHPVAPSSPLKEYSRLSQNSAKAFEGNDKSMVHQLSQSRYLSAVEPLRPSVVPRFSYMSRLY